MSSLLNRASLPLWVLIIIIVVGSLCILGTVGFIIRCVIVKRRAGAVAADEDDEFAAPMRRVTVRRGRVVPQSHYLSLTGSKYGLNEFDSEALTARSKSPFEWLSKNKKQGQEEMSQRRSLYGRRDFTRSTSSLALATTPEKQYAASTQEVERPPSPTALPSPPPMATPSPTPDPSRGHFSRPFHSSISPGSPFPQDKRLSMIEEASSPHTSMISTNSRRRSSKMSLIPTPTDSNYPRRSNPTRRPSSNTPTASTHSLPSQLSSHHDILTPLAYRGSRSSLGETEPARPSLSYYSSIYSNSNLNHDGTHDYPRSPRMPFMAEESVYQPQTQPQPQPQPQPQSQRQGQRQRPQQGLWNSQPQTSSSFPTRTTSMKKGNVLRKKSLKKMEIVSTVS